MYLAQGRRTDSVKFFNFFLELKRRVHHGDSAGLLKLSVRRKAPTDADAVKAVGHGSRDILVPVPHHDGAPGVQASQGGTDDPGLSGGSVGSQGFIVGSSVDACEEVVYPMVFQHKAGNALGFLRSYGHWAAGLREKLQEFKDAGIQLAPGNTGLLVMPPVALNGFINQCGRHPGQMEQRVTELGTHHGVQDSLFRNRKAHFAEGCGNAACDTAGWIDKGAVQIEYYGHLCLSHRVSFPQVAACLKLACRYGNTSAVVNPA